MKKTPKTENMERKIGRLSLIAAKMGELVEPRLICKVLQL